MSVIVSRNEAPRLKRSMLGIKLPKIAVFTFNGG